MHGTTTTSTLADKLFAAREASLGLAQATTQQKNSALESLAVALEVNAERIVEANAHDLEAGTANGLGDALLDRLRLDAKRIDALAAAVREIIGLTDPIGQSVRGMTLPNGLRVNQVRVPFGVVGAIYEARPNVTIDIASLALKSGNAVVLRGGSAAQNSNRVLVELIQDALAAAGLPPLGAQTIDEFGRDGAAELMRARGLVDVLIPRGSANLINTVVAESTVPVIETGAGIVHIFVDESAPTQWAVDIVRNAKVQRPSVCNAVETVLIHRAASERVLPALMQAMRDSSVTVHADQEVVANFPDALVATEENWSTEYLSLELSVRIVDTLDEAIEHIRRYSTRHTESIVTNDLANAERFLNEVDSAVVMVNASTRFTDGGEFGFGAEVGISTQKLHARGPMGLPELTSTKWIVRGSGQVRA
ncbi:glutamate-5-semialdehyde dehydrogenase [Cryobacterium sp. BB736]|uniref:glutamate-5-semialdehyde dehydrogenase n=1 Tax=Cryobacterium sp. BB736 TaxID=2746963 RepID=UPI0018762482|nr:glutamate-5-semialdehyde dehydrogenase [Cryobacterium sp. BB736]